LKEKAVYLSLPEKKKIQFSAKLLLEAINIFIKII